MNRDREGGMTYFHKGCTASHKSHRYCSAMFIENIQHVKYAYHQKIGRTNDGLGGGGWDAGLVGQVNVQALTMSLLQFLV